MDRSAAARPAVGGRLRHHVTDSWSAAGFFTDMGRGSRVFSAPDLVAADHDGAWIRADGKLFRLNRA